MTRFEIGPGLSCDLDLLIASRLLIQASSGQGKTRTVRRILEQTHGKVQHLVIDPEGEYATLREKFDYVLAAPKGGDVVAHPKHAALLAHKLLELGVSAILDIYELNPDDRRLFVKNFLMALVDAPRNLWHPCLVVIDEVHNYCPEKGDAVSAGAVEALSTRGRKRGFCLIAATQRLAKFKKDAAAELSNKLIGGTNLDIDIDRAGEELGFPKSERVKALRGVPPGIFWAFGRAFTRVIQDTPSRIGEMDVIEPVRVKVGPVKTSHPEPGQTAAPTPAPSAKVRAVLDKLSALPAEAEEREKSLDTLRKELAAAKRELMVERSVGKGTGFLHQVEVENRVEVPVVLDADLTRAEKLVDRVEKVVLAFAEADRKRIDLISQQMLAIVVALRATHGSIQGAVAPAVAAAAKIGTGGGSVPSQRPQRAPAVSRPSVASPSTGSNVSDPSIGKSGLRRMLIALAQRGQGLTRAQLGLRSQVSSKGGSFDTYLSKARVNGWVDSSGERIVITEAGLLALGSYDPLPTGRDLLDHYVREFGSSGAARMLIVLGGVYPSRMSRADLGAAADVSASGGSFDTYVSKLKTLELVDVTKEGIKASDEFFLE